MNDSHITDEIGNAKVAVRNAIVELLRCEMRLRSFENNNGRDMTPELILTADTIRDVGKLHDALCALS